MQVARKLFKFSHVPPKALDSNDTLAAFGKQLNISFRYNKLLIRYFEMLQLETGAY